MARQVLPIAGAIVGAYFGGATGAQWGYAIGSLIGNAVDPQVIKGPALGEGQVNTAREGGFRPIVLGTGCVGCNIINVSPEKIRTQRERQSKGGGPVSETKRRYRTFAMRICEGPIAGLLRIWQGEKLVYDVRPESVIPAESAEYAEGFTFYLGDEGQLPDPDLEAYLGAGNANAYRGTAYIVFTNFDLTDSQGAIPNFRFEVSGSVDVEQPSIMALGSLVAGFARFTALSDDGLDWDLSLTAALTSSHYLLGVSGGRVLNHQNYSDDRGESWQTSTGLVLGGGGTVGDSRGDIVLIPGSNAGVNRSTDRGLTYSMVTSIESNYVAMLPDIAVSATLFDTRIALSINDGESWVWTATHGLNLSSAVGTIAKSDNTIVLGGGDSDTGKPAIFYTQTGLSGVKIVINSAVGTIVQALAWGIIGGEEIWVLGTDEDELFWSNDLIDWHESTTPMRARTLIFNQDYFVLGGAIDDDPVIATSSDGKSFITTTQPFTDQVIDFTLVTPQATVDRISLSTIVSFVHRRCGHTSGQYDVSELTDLVDGIVFADSYTGSDAIRTILPVYFADAAEYDGGAGYKINYVKRGKPVIRALTIDDLVDDPEEAVRQDSLERPAKLHLHFQNPTIGYAAAKATSSRSSPDIKVTGEVSIQVPITFASVDEAAQRSVKLHKVTWVEVAGTQEMMITDKDLDLVPTDCIGLSLRGILTRYRMVTQEYVEGTMKCEFMADRQSAYTSNVTGIPLPEPEPPPPSIAGPTVSVFGDWPALVDSHDALISYAAATGRTPAWWGATYQRSLDDGANYDTVAMFDDFNTIMGILQEPITDASPHFTDTTNVLRVQLYTDDEIDSLTQQQFLSEGGGFALSWMDSDTRRWEFGQYRDAEQDSNGDWLLTTLLRGRLNTETAGHEPGDMFVLLDNSLKVMPMQSAWLGMELTHRAYSHGNTPESAVPYSDEFTGESQREWPVANLLLERDGDDIEATAVPRHRFGTDDAPVQSINHDGYRWTATDGSNVVNIDTAGPTYTFGVTGWATPVTVTVAQLNRITGAGPSVSEDIV